jgi:hypothetical protein
MSINQENPNYYYQDSQGFYNYPSYPWSVPSSLEPPSVNFDFSSNTSTTSPLKSDHLNHSENFPSEIFSPSKIQSNSLDSNEDSILYSIIPIKNPDIPLYLHYFESIQIERSNEEESIDDLVETTSAAWLPINSMKDLYKYNENFVANVEILRKNHKITGWKKSKGDGNCFYRAVISRYFEVVMGVYLPVEKTKKFLNLLENCSKFAQTSEVDYIFIDALESCIRKTVELIEVKKKNSLFAFKNALKLLQNKEFDLNLVRCARVITLMTFKNNYERWKDFESEELTYFIMSMGTEAEGLMLACLPLGLKVRVNLFNTFGFFHKEIYSEDYLGDFEINIIRRNAHYDILYSIQESERDLFDFNSSTYNYLKPEYQNL